MLICQLKQRVWEAIQDHVPTTDFWKIGRDILPIINTISLLLRTLLDRKRKRENSNNCMYMYNQNTIQRYTNYSILSFNLYVSFNFLYVLPITRRLGVITYHVNSVSTPTSDNSIRCRWNFHFFERIFSLNKRNKWIHVLFSLTELEEVLDRSISCTLRTG